MPPAKTVEQVELCVQDPNGEWRLAWKTFVAEHMLTSGMNMQRLAQALKEELEATKRSSIYDKDLKSWVYSEWEPDWAIRQAARRDALKILGINVDKTSSLTNVNVNVDEKSLTIVSELSDAEKILSKIVDLDLNKVKFIEGNNEPEQPADDS